MSCVSPPSPALSSSDGSCVPHHSSNARRCKVCSACIPVWETHDLCFKHRKDCASNHTCDICVSWSMEVWADLVVYVKKCLEKQKVKKVSQKQRPIKKPLSSPKHASSLHSDNVKINVEDELTQEILCLPQGIWVPLVLKI